LVNLRERTVWETQTKNGDNIKIDFKDIESEDVDWIHLIKDMDQWWAAVNTVMNLWVS
jgi:hypothetical protein